jgi:hypothetical protein
MAKGGSRPGAGRPKGSQNKLTLAKHAVAEVLDVPADVDLAQAVHQRGHRLLGELERITLDPTQPVAARLIAAKTALPFMLSKYPQHLDGHTDDFAVTLIERLHEGRRRAALVCRQD